MSLVYCFKGSSMFGWFLDASLVPSLIYHTRKKSLVKRIFNFGSVRQDLDAANQIAEQSLRHGHVWNTDCNGDLKEPREGRSPVVQQAIDEVTHRLSLAKCTWSLGEAKSSVLLTRIIMQARIVLLCERHNTSCMFNWEPKLNTRFTRLFFCVW